MYHTLVCHALESALKNSLRIRAIKELVEVSSYSYHSFGFIYSKKWSEMREGRGYKTRGITFFFFESTTVALGNIHQGTVPV